MDEETDMPTVTVSETAKEKSYAYDKVGNRLTEDDNGSVSAYAYNEFNQMTQKSADGETAAYSYDANGNQLSEIRQTGKTLNEYDVLNRLAKTTVKGNVANEATGAVSEQTLSVTENLYNGDGDGQRIRKTVTDGAGAQTATNYYYQDGFVSYTEDGTGARTSFNILGLSNNILASERYNGSYANKFYTYTKDQQGSAMTVLNDSGEFVTGYAYDDFGQTAKYGDENFYNEVCYTGGIYDESTSLYYLNARYYDPQDGRFMTRDTYRGDDSDVQTLELYTYCANNPINFIDSSGHKYRPNVGVKYAFKWWNKHNSKYPDFDNDNDPETWDCANFVSQCIWYAGKTAQGTDLKVGDENGWYCKKNWTMETLNKTVSSSWRGVLKFKDFWKKNSKYSEVAIGRIREGKEFKKMVKSSKLSVGDAVQFASSSGVPSHTVFISHKYSRGDFGYAAHSDNHKYKGLWKDIKNSNKYAGDRKLLIYHMNNSNTTKKARKV